MIRGRALSVADAAIAAGVSEKTIRRAYRGGDLAHVRPGGRRRVVILEDELETWLQSAHPIAVPALAAGSRLALAATSSPRRRDEPGSVDRLKAIEARRGE